MKLTKEFITEKLPQRPKDANKGTFGRVLVFAGSEKYPGAAYLACAACYRVGAGLVTLVTEKMVKIIISKKIPEVTFLSPVEALEEVNQYNVLLLGPGWEQEAKKIKLLTQVFKKNLPMVIDGDGLNLLFRMGGWWKKLNGQVILTPHPGEMNRLTGMSVKEIQTDRVDVAQYWANKWGTVVVLKGANTVVVSPAGETLISPFINPLLATAGTGDILSGIIAGLIAQGLKAFDAAGVGVYIHGMAGEMMRKQIGEIGLLASELLPVIPQVIKLLHIPEHRIC